MPCTSSKVKRKPRTANATTNVSEIIRKRILTGEWPEGSQLRQEALSREFGVSRIPVREALRLLETEGLVTISDNKGAVVSKLSLAEISELLRVRILLECNVLWEAIPQQTCTDITAADEILVHLEDALENKNISIFSDLNTQFFITLFRASDRPQTLLLIEKLHNRTNRYTRIPILLTDFGVLHYQQLSQLLSLCRLKDTIAATSLLRENILNTEKAIESYYLTVLASQSSFNSHRKRYDKSV